MPHWSTRVQSSAEHFLTWRRRRKWKARRKQADKGTIWSWVESFLWAAVVVLLLNQYLLQAYVIPSGSMIPSLEIGDRIFVNKAVYGPELIPGYGKLPGFTQPERNEIVIFENPSYVSKGPVIELFHRLVFMVTLSLVNLDRDEQGRPREQFLIKRAAGFSGDRIRVNRGIHEFRPEGAGRWMSEDEHMDRLGIDYTVRRLVDTDVLGSFEYAGAARAYQEYGLRPTPRIRRELSRIDEQPASDRFSVQAGYHRTRLQVAPHVKSNRRNHAEAASGWYVPRDYIMGLGDNRDNSRDGRDFGPVPRDAVLGRSMIRYWPFDRVGTIR
ncbi:MAG: signal peptidase I [Spirochaetales bacterium]